MARNLSFLKSKKFWIPLILGVLLFLSAVVFFFRDSAIQTSQREPPLPESENTSIASFIYRYDASEKTYVPETSESWQNKDFVRYVFDVSEESSIAQCSYFVYDTGEERAKVFSTRKCNAPIVITVGEQGVCSSQGKDSCILYVYATDGEGRGGEFDIGDYSIDYESPLAGKVFAQENQTYPIIVEEGKQVNYTVAVSDNIEMLGCWLYGDQELIGTMKVSPLPCVNNAVCEARISYALPAGKEKQILWVQCADQYDVVEDRYLNIGYGERAEIMVKKNHPPKISLCRVTPAQGTRETLFTFEAQAYDPDNQKLQYTWEFGDGSISDEENPRYRYKNTGVFQPKIIVQDEQGEMAECSTAWTVITE